MTNMNQPVRVQEDGFLIETTRDSNLTGVGLRGHINVYAQSATQQFPLGTKIIRGDQVFRYCKAGEALTIATPLQSAAAAHAEQDDDIVCGAAAAAGAYTVEVTSTANLDTSPNDTANNFAEGYLFVNDEAGEGQCYKIKSNEALSGTDNATFTLYDPIITALTTVSQLGLAKNPYKDVIKSAAVVTGMFIGVPLIAVTSGYYFWAQTGGVAPVVAHAAVAKGTAVIVGTTAAKADPIAANSVDADGATEVVIGYPITPGAADTETFLVFLTGDR